MKSLRKYRLATSISRPAVAVLPLRKRIRTFGDIVLKFLQVEPFDLTASTIPAASTPVLHWIFGSALRRLQIPDRDLAALRRISEDAAPVYVLHYRSSLDLILLSMRLTAEGLPGISLAAGFDALLLQPLQRVGRILLGRLAFWLSRTRPPHAIDDGILRGALADRRAVVIFLREHRQSARRWAGHRRAVDPVPIQEHLKYLLRIRTRLNHDVHLIPVVPVWDNHVVRLRRGLLDAVFGTRLMPGFLRRAVQVLRHRQGVMHFPAPISLAQFVEDHAQERSSLQVKNLRWRLNVAFEETNLVTRGPKLLPRRHLIRTILNDPGVRVAAEKVARKKGRRGNGLNVARRYLNEMAGDYQRWTINLFEKILNYMMRHNIESVVCRPEDFERLRAVIRRGPVILLPSHRSHLDYLLASYVMFHHQIMTPYVCAGDNLNFFPAGPLFRRSGAFFIRRAFDESTLYPTVLRRYLKSLLNSRVIQEVFIEGGRSRTGVLRPPMLGILSLMTRAYFSGDCKDVYFVPVSITYDRVPEEQAYVREMRGETKRAEGFADLLRIWRLRHMRLGRVYFNFAEPISSREFFRRDGTDPEVAQEHAKRKATARLGNFACREIQNQMVITPTALLAAVLAASGPRDLSEAKIFETVAALEKLLRDATHGKPLCMFSDGEDFDSGIARALALFRQAGIVSGAETTIHVHWRDPSVPFLLDYYRAGILHLLAPLALAQIQHAQPDVLADMLVREFPVGFGVEITAARKLLAERDLDPATAAVLRASMAGIFEAQRATVQTLYDWLRGDLPWLQQIREDKIIRHALTGVAASASPEARHWFHVANALQLAADRKLVTIRNERQGRRIKRTILLQENAPYESIEAWLSQLQGVLRELAAAQIAA